MLNIQLKTKFYNKLCKSQRKTIETKFYGFNFSPNYLKQKLRN